MYVYFDVNGNLKEIINLPVREGSVKANTIYIYVEPVSNPQPVDNIFSLPQRFTNAKINFRDDGGNNINPNGGNSVPMVKLTGDDVVQIPFDPKKDIYFFKYGFKYEMWSVELPSTVTNVNGLVSATAYLYNLSEQLALNTFSFNVEASVGVKPDRTMSEAQYSYLYNKIQFVEEIEESFVPYTGADNDVNLGNNSLITSKHIHIQGTIYDTYIDSRGINITADNYSSFLDFPILDTDETETIATQEWITGLIGYNSSNDFFDLGTNDLYIHGSSHFIEIGSSDYELRILQNRMVGHYDGISTTLLLPLSEEEDVTETLATREWVNPSFAKSIEASADGTVPYRYNFTLKNGDGDVISTTYVDLEAEAIQADLEQYVDNAIDALKDDIEDGTVVADSAINTDFTNGEFIAFDMNASGGYIDLPSIGFYYIFLHDTDIGSEGFVDFGIVMVNMTLQVNNQSVFPGYTSGLKRVVDAGDGHKYYLSTPYSNNPNYNKNIYIAKDTVAFEEGIVYVKKIR